MQNYKLSLSYDGTDFFGWQRQPDKRTIQGVLEESLTKITRKKINVIGAGRTDAGVHAQAQAANFKANLSLKDEELIRALNSLLPDEIRVNYLKTIDMDFHAPTVYFPLIVKEAMMIEPTETESKETLDNFVEAMKKIAKQAENDPDVLKNAPVTTPLRRLDETKATRELDLRWSPPSSSK